MSLGVVVMTTAQQSLNSAKFELSKIQQSLNSDSAQVQILLTARLRFAMMSISDKGTGWKYD